MLTQAMDTTAAYRWTLPSSLATTHVHMLITERRIAGPSEIRSWLRVVRSGLEVTHHGPTQPACADYCKEIDVADQPHITFPTCPNPDCQAKQKAVGNWEHMTWYCFKCHYTGSFEVSFTHDPKA